VQKKGNCCGKDKPLDVEGVVQKKGNCCGKK
jgi:hypothetical protein